MSNNDLPGRPTRVIRFEDGDRAGEAQPVGTSRIETVRPVEPPPEPMLARPAPAPAPAAPPARRERDLRPWLIGGAAAIALGVIGGLLLSPKTDEGEKAPSTQVATTTTETRTERTEAEIADLGAVSAAAAARESYRDPDIEPVRRALTGVRTDYAEGGASAVARQSRACFEGLSRAPSYAELDYCLAYDAYGQALARRLAQGQPLPAGSWFADTEARAIRTANAVVAGKGDAAARLLDIRRLTVQAAAADPARDDEPAEVAQAAPPARAPVQVAEAAPTPPRAAPAPAPYIPPEPRVAPRPPEPEPAPRAEPVQRAAVDVGSARPSFNCRNARSASERMVCSDPVLAAADWRLHNVFERAWANTSDRRALRAEQDRWLAAREGAAPDPRAVLQVYETRIDELAANY